MRRYWTADWHVGHGNIIRYANRPFRDVEHMNDRLIGEANMRAKKGDLLVHVGDFCCRGTEKGVEGLRLPWSAYAERVNATLMLIEGNHDKQNKVKVACRHMFCRVSHFNVFVTHWPTDNEGQDPLLIDYVRKTCDFVVVGHVHNAWIASRRDGIMNINVGVDVHSYRPVSDDELVALYLKEKCK